MKTSIEINDLNMTEEKKWRQRRILVVLIITLINCLIFTFTEFLGGFDKLDRSLFEFTCKLKTGDWQNPCIYPYPGEDTQNKNVQSIL